MIRTLTITLPPLDLYDERSDTFITTTAQVATLNHCLVSIMKWEQLHRKPFLVDEARTLDETKSYIKCMSEAPLDDFEIDFATQQKISKYLQDAPTATWFREDNDKPSYDVITAEVLYAMMVLHGIPFECQYWHIHNLLTLIRVCNDKSKPPEDKKMTQSSIAKRRAMNAKRRAAMKKHR